MLIIIPIITDTKIKTTNNILQWNQMQL